MTSAAYPEGQPTGRNDEPDIHDDKSSRDYEYFGSLLVHARTQAGLTLQALSEKTEISVSTLSNWELGMVANPKPSSLLCVATSLQLNPPDQIFNWLEENDRRLREQAAESSVNRVKPEKVSRKEYSPLQAMIDILEQKEDVNPFIYFGVKLARARRRAGFTVQELARKAGISQQALSKWENGLVESPSPTHLLNVGAVLGLDDRLFVWIDENKKLLQEVAAERSVDGIPLTLPKPLSKKRRVKETHEPSLNQAARFSKLEPNFGS